MKYTILLIGATLAAMSQPVSAKQKLPVFVETKPVKDTATVTLDSTKAYVFLRTKGAMPLHFVRIPTVEEQQSWKDLRATAFVEARADYTKKLAAYEKERNAPHESSNIPMIKKPVEPTEDNFDFPAFAQMAGFTVGPFNRFGSKEGSSYLQAVTPGTYRFYGQTSPLLGGGTCYCMGSVSFSAEAGKITDLGMLAPDPSDPPMPKGDSSTPRIFAYAQTLSPVNDSMPVDPRLSALPRVAARYHAAGKIANFLGVGLSRLPPIAGVLAYDRDRVVDLMAAKTAAVQSPGNGGISSGPLPGSSTSGP